MKKVPKATMNYPKKPGFNHYQSPHCAYITYSVKTWFLKKFSVPMSSGIVSLERVYTPSTFYMKSAVSEKVENVTCRLSWRG